jgi:hypothetical protein
VIFSASEIDLKLFILIPRQTDYLFPAENNHQTKVKLTDLRSILQYIPQFLEEDVHPRD